MQTSEVLIWPDGVTVSVGSRGHKVLEELEKTRATCDLQVDEVTSAFLAEPEFSKLQEGYLTSSSPRTEPGSPALQADSLPTELSGYGVSTVRNTHIFNCEEGSASLTPMLFKGQLYFHLMVYQNFLTPASTSSQEAIVKF